MNDYEVTISVNGKNLVDFHLFEDATAKALANAKPDEIAVNVYKIETERTPIGLAALPKPPKRP